MSAIHPPPIIISSCHTGSSPAPGVGIARSIKAGYPNSILIGKDQSAFSTGLHSPYFDDVWLTRPWGNIDLDKHLIQIKDRLDATSGFFIPGSDFEARWLATHNIPSVLSPSLEAFTSTVKPFANVHEYLPSKAPAFLDLKTDPREIYNFAVSNGWRVWLKGPMMDARKVYNWPNLLATWDGLLKTWGREHFFIQKEITGLDVTVAFSAYKGKLLGAAFMEKRQMTEEGKCWSGEVNACPADLFEDISKFVEKLQWTGGGELEFVRDEQGQLWFIDLNYRFPAWIYGATLAGINLPGLLVEAATGIPHLKTEAESHQFTRLIIEVPVSNDMQLPAPPVIKSKRKGVGVNKLTSINPGGLPQLMQRISNEISISNAKDQKLKKFEKLTSEEHHSLAPIFEHLSQPNSNTETPFRHFVEERAKAPFELISNFAKRVKKIQFSPAYSIKTNPDPRLMKLALEYGFRAEGISANELLAAHEVGHAFENMVYNGPVPLNPKDLHGNKIHVVFADSMESLKRLCQLKPSPAAHIGVRLKPFESSSRFGIRLESFEDYQEVAKLVKELLPADVGFAVHQHHQSSTNGEDVWLSQTRAFLQQAKLLEELCEKPIRIIDIGGGWTHESFIPFMGHALEQLTDEICHIFPNADEVIIEPGKAICEQSQFLVSRVLEKRGKEFIHEVVSDACLAELPLAVDFGRSVYHVNKSGEIAKLTTGVGRILGRICMEHDILANGILLPEKIEEDDLLIFSHAGAYESSMSYKFGNGKSYE